jgi:hypothetical protein
MRGVLLVIALCAMPAWAQGASPVAHPAAASDAPVADSAAAPSASTVDSSATDAVATTAPALPSEGPARPAEDRSGRVLGAVLWGVAGLAVTSAYAVGAGFAGDSRAGGTLAIVGGVVSAGAAGAAIGLWVNWRRKEPTSMVDYLLAPLVGGLAGALVGGVLAGISGSPPGTSRLVTHVVITSLLFCETAGLVAVRLLD